MGAGFIKGGLGMAEGKPLSPDAAAAGQQMSEADHRIIKSTAPDHGQKAVAGFELPDLRKRSLSKIPYSEVKKRFGPVAQTDPDFAKRPSKDRKFNLNDHAKNRLEVEAEESRAIEKLVGERMALVEELVKADAEKQGFDQGFTKGKEEALTVYTQQAEQHLLALEMLLSELEATKETLFKANERYLMELMFRVSRMVIMRELSTDKDYVLRLASALIERSGARESIRVRINSDDAAIVEDLRKGIFERLGALKNLDIMASPDVRQGGCTIETDWSSIDASVGAQLDSIHQALTSATPVAPSEGTST